MLRGFSAFDLFLEQHPEFTERVTFIAQLMPSRTDVPQYAEYLERIEALVAVVNHRHGTPDWMPIQLKLRDDLEEAMAAYKHYDVLLVNAMFDGMNLVAKEGPIVNEREGVSILSENTGAHEELGEFALSVNPFDIQELANSIHAALTMDPARAPPARAGLEQIVTSRDPGDWIDEQLADIRAKGRGARRRRPGPTRYSLRPSADDPARTHIRSRAAARPAGGGAARAKILADVRAAIEAQGELLRHDDWGERALELPDRHKAERRVPPAPVHAGTHRAARAASTARCGSPTASPLPHHQAEAGRAGRARHARPPRPRSPERRRARETAPRRRRPVERGRGRASASRPSRRAALDSTSAASGLCARAARA